MLNDPKSDGILARIANAPYSTMPPGSVVVPFYEHAVHLLLAQEAAQTIGRHGGDDLLMLLDSHTASQLHALDELRGLARNIVVFGAAPPAWGRTDNITFVEYGPDFRSADRIFLMISSTVSVAVLGSLQPSAYDNEAHFTGGWTVQRVYIAHAIEALLGDKGRTLLGGMDAPDEGSIQLSELTMHLMTLHANALATRHQDMAMDKSDLFSVLNILKAISAKRRAHDILFVFVEQIARVVPSDRCSVVRVWGGAKYGLVLASHEDANIVDRKIELAKYPELQKSLMSREKVIINDVSEDPLTAALSDVLHRANIHAILVIPIVLFDESIGSLFLRAVRSEGGFSLREISFFEIVTEAAANALERAQLFESIQIANENLERLAITDGLTGLHNHRFFRERLDHEVERALRYKLPLSCLILDIDDFKQINDTYGHLAGDRVLKEIAERITHCIRKTDTCARYGGEEFVVIMPQTGVEGAVTQADRIRAMIAEAPFPALPQEQRVTVSLGVGMLDPNEMLTGEDLLRAADQALYRAKRNGKNRVAGPGQ